MIRVLFLFGTRPEAIKLAPLIKEFQKRNQIETRVGITAQHREMLDQVLEFFEIVPDYDLNIMKADQSLHQLTSDIIIQVSEIILKKYSPDWIIVQGDTTTAMAGALAAFYANIKVAHVEAGLRSHNLIAPFPEEMNRQVISRIASAHFSPTASAVSNLRLEGIINHVFQVGNTVIDAVHLALKNLEVSDKNEFEKFFTKIDFRKKIILVTCHRRESFGKPFGEICKAIHDLAEGNENYQVVYPLHLNPNIQDNVRKYLHHPRILLMEPLSYPRLLWLMTRCSIILTDSGGIQEEAPTIGKPVIVLREVTERTEGIESGSAILAGTNRSKIVEQTISVLEDPIRYKKMINRPNPYGDGKASVRIADILISGQ